MERLIRIKTLQDAVTKIESVLDERVNEMEGDKMFMITDLNILVTMRPLLPPLR